MENDPVNHPSHYTRLGKIEVIDITERLPFSVGNAVKYIVRAGHKDPSKTLEDLEKAEWYLERAITTLAVPERLAQSSATFYWAMPPVWLAEEFLAQIDNEKVYLIVKLLIMWNGESQMLSALRHQYKLAHKALSIHIDRLAWADLQQGEITL